MAGLLDQGYWPDGLYTAPSDEALASDIAAAKALGFNLLRKHAKATACCVPLLYLPVHQPCAAQLPPMCCSMTTPLPPDDRPLTTLHRLTAPPPLRSSPPAGTTTPTDSACWCGKTCPRPLRSHASPQPTATRLGRRMLRPAAAAAAASGVLRARSMPRVSEESLRCWWPQWGERRASC
jgi:hypothetical protein